jgi:hypothetical protein
MRASSCGGTWKEESGSKMKHPSQETLALHAGGDLRWPLRWKIARHLAACGQCRDDVAAYSEVREVLPELKQMPDVAWNRLAAEMRANIRLGLAAGECIRESDPVIHQSRRFSISAPRTFVAFASVCAMLVAAMVLEKPAPVHAGEITVQATENGIQKRSGDRAFGLMNAGAQDVTYTVGAQGTMGARYVDPETGVMTMTKVYVE